VTWSDGLWSDDQKEDIKISEKQPLCARTVSLNDSKAEEVVLPTKESRYMNQGSLWNAVSDGGAWAEATPKPIGSLDPPEEAPPPLPCEVPTLIPPSTGKTARGQPSLGHSEPNSGSLSGSVRRPSSDFGKITSNKSLDQSGRSTISPNLGRLSEFDGNRDLKAFHTQRQRISITREKARVEATRKNTRPLRALSISELIKTSAFDNFVGFIILLNAATIGIQTDYNAANETDQVPVSFYVIEQLFALWFTIELSLRRYGRRCVFFVTGSDGGMWNYFDTLVVSAQLLEVFFEFVARSTSVDASNFRVLRVLRILRLVRILRVVRVLHLFSELRAIMSSIMGSFRSLVWVVVLLLLMIYIVAVFFTQSVTDHKITLRETKKSLTANDETLSYYFGSMGRAILSLWQAMSGGLDWDSLAGPLFDNLSFLTGMAFACFIAFGVLALMNVVTGVFVQTALLSAREEEDTFMRSQVIALFHIADKEDKNAVITRDEIMESLDDPRTAKEWKSIGVQAADARDLFRLLDVDNEEQVSFEEFMGGCLRLNGTAKAFDLLTVMQEQRKNEEYRKIWTLHVDDSLEQLNESLRTNKDDLNDLLRQSASITEQVCRCSDDVAVILTSLAAEMAELKQMLRPIRVMEEILHADSNHNGGRDAKIEDESQNRFTLV
jgi:hypothetical protein